MTQCYIMCCLKRVLQSHIWNSQHCAHLPTAPYRVSFVHNKLLFFFHALCLFFPLFPSNNDTMRLCVLPLSLCPSVQLTPSHTPHHASIHAKAQQGNTMELFVLHRNEIFIIAEHLPGTESGQASVSSQGLVAAVLLGMEREGSVAPMGSKFTLSLHFKAC